MMTKKKKKQSRSLSSSVYNTPKKTLEPSSDSSPSPSPRLLLSIFRSKLASGKDLKHMFRGRSKTMPGLSSQSRIVRCPKCHKLLQEPIDATTYKCSGCDSILQAKRWELEGNHKSIPEAFLSSQNRSLSTDVESSTNLRNNNSRASSPFLERGYRSETVYKRETSDIRREWMQRADEFSAAGDSDVFVSARSSPYNGRYEDQPRVPFYPASPSPSSAYEYGYSTPFQGSQVSVSEQSYYHRHHHHHHHQQPNQLKQYRSEGWFQESSSVCFPGETSDGKYNHWSSQSQLKDLQYHNLYESSSSATVHRSVYSERSYQAVAAPHPSKREAMSSHKDKKKYVREKNPVVKRRHVLPSAGGAPFATCSYCLELLQLPQVSPSGRHKRYRVRCGSCSGVLKFSIRERAFNVLESPSFTGYADETVNIRRDSASEGHGEIYPEDSHRSGSDNGLGDRICKSSDQVTSMWNQETYEDKRIKEGVRSISSKFIDSRSEELQPKWKTLLNHKLRESSEATGEASSTPLESSEEAHTPEPANKDKEKNVYETCVMSEKNRDTEELDWVETRENEEYGWRLESMEDNPELHLENSRYIKESNSDESSSNGETFEEKAVKEDTTEHIPSTPESPTVTITRIHEELSNYENKNLHEDRYELEEFTNQINKTLELCNEEEDGSVVSLEKLSETDEERLASQQVDSPKQNVENSCGTPEPVYFKAGGYAGESTWAEIMGGDRAGLHLEEYENYNKPFELVTTLEPDEVVDGRSGSSSRHSFGNSEERDVFRESQPEPSQYECDNPSGGEELSNTAFDIVSSEFQKCRTDTDDTLEPRNMVENGSVVSLEKASEANIGKTGEERLVSDQMTPQNENEGNSYRTGERAVEDGPSSHMEKLETESTDTFTKVGAAAEDEPSLHLEKFENESTKQEWTSERAPTFRLHEYGELGTIPEPDEYADDGSSETSSRDSFNKHLVQALLQLENCDNEEKELKQTFEWTSGRALTFRLNEYEPETMLEQDEERSESISDHGSPKEREMNHEREFLLEEDDRFRLETNTSQEKEDNSVKQSNIEEDIPESEIVGLRLALYETQSSPLRSPLTSPINTPIGSPLHYLMRSQVNSHIVSPLRSPINSSGSLSDVLLFGKKT